MKRQSSTILLGTITDLILVVNGLEAGSVLDPTTIDPTPPAAAAMISAQQHESLTGLMTVPQIARRSIAINAGNRGLIHDADSHERSQPPPYDDHWASN
jgi:hypothetical protein